MEHKIEPGSGRVVLIGYDVIECPHKVIDGHVCTVAPHGGDLLNMNELSRARDADFDLMKQMQQGVAACSCIVHQT